MYPQRLRVQVNCLRNCYAQNFTSNAPVGQEPLQTHCGPSCTLPIASINMQPHNGFLVAPAQRHLQPATVPYSLRCRDLCCQACCVLNAASCKQIYNNDAIVLKVCVQPLCACGGKGTWIVRQSCSTRSCNLALAAQRRPQRACQALVSACENALADVQTCLTAAGSQALRSAHTWVERTIWSIPLET